MIVHKFIYWVSITIVSILFLTSATMNIINYEIVADFYGKMHFPEWLIIPSALVKIFAIGAILFGKPKVLKEWAFAGLFFNAILAFSALQMNGNIAGMWAFIAAIAIMSARIFEEKAYPDVTDADVINI